MDDLDFYNIAADPVNKLTQETMAALVKLFRRVEKLEKVIKLQAEWIEKALPWLEKVRDSLTLLKNGDYLDDSEGIQYELGEIKKLETLIAQGGK